MRSRLALLLFLVTLASQFYDSNRMASLFRGSVLGSDVRGLSAPPAAQQQQQPVQPAQQQGAAAAATNVCIVGGAGYVGSFLSLYLATTQNHLNVTIFDQDISHIRALPEFQNSALGLHQMHSKEFSASLLQSCRTVVFLGGCTGRRACDDLKKDDPQAVQQVNVDSVISLASLLDNSQHLIAASTSAITETRDGASEDDTVALEALDVYAFSMRQREIQLREYVNNHNNTPRISLCRFGTVIGNSSGQRTDLMVPSFFRGAYTAGTIAVQGRDTMRSFLTLEDLSAALHTLIVSHSQQTSAYNIWHLASFNATVMKVASTVASVTGARIQVVNRKENSPSPAPFTGFSLDCTKFIRAFSFSFRGTLGNTMQAFDQAVPHSITPKGPHRPELQLSEAKTQIMPCPVCSARKPQLVLDLGMQPLANDLAVDDTAALERPRFPLQLVRCTVCNHYHLSHVVDRGDLFDHYLYRSATSNTLQQYFAWLAKRITTEVVVDSSADQQSSLSVLELACNDGSQLDQFQKLGWNTFGVDPAKNLVTIAQSKNHTVFNGFWPLSSEQMSKLPSGNNLTAIVAQNVVAHVPNATAFLRACAEMMGSKTKLYVQTSQCDMQQQGQFDTIYHEHISFFTGHSFFKASQLAGLTIMKFETTPIHGKSCLVTMMRDTIPNPALPEIAPSLHSRLMNETKDELTDVFFAQRFSMHANAIRDWLRKEILYWRGQNFYVAGYGAAAKGMVLLHFMLGNRGDGTNYVHVVLDDAPLKQGKFCPGTRIQVRPVQILTEMDMTRPLLLVVFAWNFAEEVIQRVRSYLRGRGVEKIMLLLPFPAPRLLLLEIETGKASTVRSMPWEPIPIPNPLRDPNRKKAILVATKERSDETITASYIQHHSPMFDEAVFLGFDDVDSKKIITSSAPYSWKMVDDSVANSVDEVKKLFPNSWILPLHPSEFVKENFRLSLDHNLKTTVDFPTFKFASTGPPVVGHGFNDSSWVPSNNTFLYLSK